MRLTIQKRIANKSTKTKRERRTLILPGASQVRALEIRYTLVVGLVVADGVFDGFDRTCRSSR